MNLKKNEFFESEFHNNIIFINNGILRAFTEDSQGNTYTRIIAWENRFITNISIFKEFGKSNEIIECLENAEIIYIDKELFYKLLEQSPNLKNIYFNILSEYNELYVRMTTQLKCRGIKQKMEYLKSDFPNLINRINDSVIASFLGMSRESYVRGKIYLRGR
ncbi:Crp/Fnr family transcriptional regulator [Riemerella anatipestifer]|nr:hypothetical protein [Riemerella anatipestifer]MCU7572331.1 hypothetical protein [Riemerella anatipestifer]MCW0493749.1 hypothetical protein [Riemerella anatipestifer]MDY3405878.1 hypothetical protein [Riemerella anatipestifer]